MASRRDSASARLKEFIEAARNPLPPEQTLIGMAREFGMIPEAPQVRIDWNDPAQHARGAHEALRPDLDEFEEPIRKAFDAFGYDPLDPFHWRKLLLAFAYAHFLPPRKGGAPKKWDDVRWCKLLSDFGEVKASSRPNASDTEVCINIKKAFAQRYARENAGTLRRNLQYARDPSRNGILAYYRDLFAVQTREWAITEPRASSLLNPDGLGQIALKWALEYVEGAGNAGLRKSKPALD
jgi:hypothetical protein